MTPEQMNDVKVRVIEEHFKKVIRDHEFKESNKEDKRRKER